MQAVCIKNSDVEPITLEELKEYLRLESQQNHDDALLIRLISTARQDFERSSGMMLIERQWERVFLGWKGETVSLMTYPVTKVDLFFLDGKGSWQAISEEKYRLDNGLWPARVDFIETFGFKRPADLKIHFTAGFGASNKDIPQDIRQALILLGAHWYEFRSGFFTDGYQADYPSLYRKIVNNYRTRRL